MWSLLKNVENKFGIKQNLGVIKSWKALDYTFKQSKTSTETEHLNIYHKSMQEERNSIIGA